jgi:hypothetical protein
METRSCRTRSTRRRKGTIDHTAEGGKELQAVVKQELTGYLEYSNDNLPLYIVVMLAQGNQQSLIARNLYEFLGAQKAGRFASWYTPHPPTPTYPPKPEEID